MENTTVKRDRKITIKIFYSIFVGFLLMSIGSTIAETIDGVVISNGIGGDAQSVLGFIFPLNHFFSLTSGIIVTGVSIVCAKLIGEANIKKANETYSSAALFGLVVSIVFGGLLLILAPVFTNLLVFGNDNQTVIDSTREYLMGMVIGLPAFIGTNFLFQMVQINGDKTRCYLSIVTILVVDVAGDLISTFVLGGGMFGMALVTSISRYASMLVLGTHFIKPRTIHFGKPANVFKNIWNMLKAGLPAASVILYAFAFQIIFNKMLLKAGGVDGVSAFSIFNTLAAFLKSPFFAIESVTMLMIGVMNGEKDSKGIWYTAKTVHIFILMALGLYTVLIEIFAPYLIAIYQCEEALASQATLFLRCFFINTLLIGCCFFLRGYIPAIRKGLVANLFSLVLEFLVPLACTLIFANFEFKYFAYKYIPEFAVVCLIAVLFLLVLKLTNKRKYSEYSFFAKNVDVDADKIFERRVLNDEEACATSTEAKAFLKSFNIESKKAFYISLAIEEICCFILQKNTKKKNSFIDVRLYIYQEQVILSIRETGKRFSVAGWDEITSSEIRDSKFGVKMVMKMVTNVEYLDTFNLNHLVLYV